MQKKYEIKSSFWHLDRTPPIRNFPIGVYQPVEKTEHSQIAILAMHGSDYLSFEPMVELAKRGFTAAGANPRRGSLSGAMADIKTAVDYMRQYPGVKKVVLMGHSQGGCLTSCYQYIAENGISRFKNTKRILPFPDIGSLSPADGLMLIDANYGIMSVLAIDPAVKNLDNGYERIPELDIYNPENGYKPGDAHYSEEFARKFQKAQVMFYKDMLASAQERYELIKTGKGRFADDEPFVVPGAGGGYDKNKLFCQDNSYLNHTRNPHPLLKKGGEISNEIVHTVRVMNDAIRPEYFNGGSYATTVMNLLSGEMLFDDDFGYDASSMWGSDWNFNPLSSRANVQGITAPLLVEGNTGSHEFIQTEYNYELAKSKDKSIVFLEGADHTFYPVKSAEKIPGEFDDVLERFADYMAEWLIKPGRFLG